MPHQQRPSSQYILVNRLAFLRSQVQVAVPYREGHGNPTAAAAVDLNLGEGYQNRFGITEGTVGQANGQRVISSCPRTGPGASAATDCKDHS